MSIQKRIFLVGYPRSGTTLLQSLIAAHPDVASFPESHFFPRLRSARPWVNRLGLASRKARETMETYFRNIGAWDTYRLHASPLMLKPSAICEAFVATLDALASQRDASFWLEKTPRHLYSIADIEALVPKVHVVHLLRRGEDTVASLYHAIKMYPEKWGKSASIDACCDRWLRDIEISLAYRNVSGHILVTYADVVQNTEVVLRQIAQEVGFEFDPAMLKEYRAVSADVVQEDEVWKERTERPIELRRGDKFKRIFSENEQDRVSRRVAEGNRKLQGLRAEVSEGKQRGT
ncbi:sulfotransferase family protein [Salisaeta longa]|uniref:sulfotransferase family protein n=1 Tax=Salisaeta longa TaxID=503170 RepID=UPI000A04061E|nr:sulfotransferase [Salisaeta longa]